MISKETLEQIVDRASLVEIIGEAVALKRSGSGFSGLCPFHSEKTPSFHIRDSDSRYHCFGFGASGDVFTYMME